MKFYWTMPAGIKQHYLEELAKYEAAMALGQYPLAWLYLERAHILGQSWPREHNYVHWQMLLFGIKLKNTKEKIGQIPRLLVGGFKSFDGHIPVGNTGGANVPPLQAMEIPNDLSAILHAYKG